MYLCIHTDAPTLKEVGIHTSNFKIIMGSKSRPLPPPLPQAELPEWSDRHFYISSVNSFLRENSELYAPKDVENLTSVIMKV